MERKFIRSQPRAKILKIDTYANPTRSGKFLKKERERETKEIFDELVDMIELPASSPFPLGLRR